MNIRTTLLAGVMAVPFLAGAALAADTGRLSLKDAVKSGNLDAARSLLSEAAKERFYATNYADMMGSRAA